MLRNKLNFWSWIHTCMDVGSQLNKEDKGRCGIWLCMDENKQG